MAPNLRPRRFSKVDGPSKPQENSLLLSKMPAEVRNEIYKHALGQSVRIPPQSKNTSCGRLIQPGLLLACKQTHSEAIRIWYATTTFVFDASQRKRLSWWTGKIGSARVSLLRNVYLSNSYFAGSAHYPAWHDNDWSIKYQAECTERLLKATRRITRLAPGVLKGGVSFGGPKEFFVFTSTPSETMEQILRTSTIEPGHGRVWTATPNEVLRKVAPFIKTL